MWVERLISEYEETKKELERYRETLDKDDLYENIERGVVGGMIRDMNYALKWMKTGRRPGNRRGIEKMNVYHRTALLDPALFPSLDIEPEERTLTDEEKRRIVDILWTLSTRERQCYLLHMCYGMSYTEIAKELKISRGTVQRYVERAREKVKKSA